MNNLLKYRYFLAISFGLLASSLDAAKIVPLENMPPECPKGGSPEAKDACWLLNQVRQVSTVYNTPYKDEPFRKISRKINGIVYVVQRYNHGLAHAVRQAYLAKRIVEELRDDPSSSTELAFWLKEKDPATIRALIKKLQLVALHYRIGRENEYSPSVAEPHELARFDENMRAGAKMFKKAAIRSGAFRNRHEIAVFTEPLFHYEYKRKEKGFKGDAKFIDQIVYAAHILDVRRVPAPSWNKPSDAPVFLAQIAEILGFSETDTSLVQKLTNYVEKLLLATGERDAWKTRHTLADEFFIQAYDPEMMLIKLNDIDGNGVMTLSCSRCN